MPDKVLIVLYALGFAVPVVALGIGALYLLRERSVVANVSVITLVTVLSIVAGVVGVAQAMFLSTHDLTVVLFVIAVTGAVALGAGLLLGRWLAARSVWEREARSRERALESSRRELVAWVSHDLRTPLAGLRAMAEALEDGVVDDPQQVAAYYRQIRGETDRLAGMVDDLFELSRIHAGALRLQLDAVALGDLVSDAVASAAPTARAKRVLIRAEPGAWPMVRGSDTELARVVRNLLHNAIMHTPSDGTVVVAGGQDAGNAWLSVQDSCGGIATEDLPRLFDVAFRGGAAHARPGGGAGLGLAIARGLVEAHSGTISVQNVDPGCRFLVALPLAQVAPSPA